MSFNLSQCAGLIINDSSGSGIKMEDAESGLGVSDSTGAVKCKDICTLNFFTATIFLSLLLLLTS